MILILYLISYIKQQLSYLVEYLKQINKPLIPL